MRTIKQQNSLLCSAGPWRFSNKSWRTICLGQYQLAVGLKDLQGLLSPNESMLSQLAFYTKVIHLSNMYACIFVHGACISEMIDRRSQATRWQACIMTTSSIINMLAMSTPCTEMAEVVTQAFQFLTSLQMPLSRSKL